MDTIDRFSKTWCGATVTTLLFFALLELFVQPSGVSLLRFMMAVLPVALIIGAIPAVTCAVACARQSSRMPFLVAVILTAALNLMAVLAMTDLNDISSVYIGRAIATVAGLALFACLGALAFDKLERRSA